MRNALFGGVALAALVMPVAAYAQETTSTIRGTVSQDGAGVAGAEVVVTNTTNGARSTATTDESGSYNLSGLQPGGPYSVVVTSPVGSATVTEIFLIVGQPFNVPVEIAADQTADIVVTASAVRGAGVEGNGPQTLLTREDIAAVASVNRDIRDLARRDPFARIEDTASGGRSISFAGVNPRFNRFSIDGVIVSDNFGLNPDANPTRRGPVPIDAISQFSTSVAPYDIRQGNFLGGAIDAVLLSGGNQFHGTGFYSQNTDSLTGNRIGSTRIDLNFKSESYGATLSGPLIRDKLFFMISGERTTQGNPIAAGVSGEAGSPVPGLTRAQIAAVQGTSQTVYGYAAGDVLDLSNDVDEKVVGKITWNVTDGQRLTLSYINAYDDQQVAGGTSLNSATPALGLESNAFGGSELLRAGIVALNSDWTDNLSTEARFLYKFYERGRPPLGEGGFAQFRVCTDTTNDSAIGSPANTTNDTNVTCGTNNPNLVLGVENSTQSNVFFTDTYGGSILTRLNINDHNLRILAEYNEIRIFNLFFQNTIGNYYFDSLSDFTGRRANQLIYANALSGNPDDTAANFRYSQWSFGVQDDWRVTDRFSVNIGARVDLFGQRDTPALNPTFTQRAGFVNNSTLKGRLLFQPRVGFNWEPIDDVTLRGGYGVFGGGTPDVYLANSFQNSGVGNNSIDIRRTTAGGNVYTINGAPLDPVVGAAVLNNVQGSTLPPQLQTLLVSNVAATNTAPVNLIDPGFDIPNALKATLSVDWAPREFLGGGWRFGADYYFSRTRSSILFTDYRSFQIGTLPDGRARYNGPNTNADILLTNGDRGRSHVGVVRLEKSFDWGLNLNFAYSLQDVKDETPATSSTAGSNYGNGAFLGNQAAYGTANDQVAWSFKYGVGFRRAFFGDYKTIFQLFGETQAGRPYSFTMDDAAATARSAVFGLTGRDDRFLLYVPASGSDALVSYDNATTQSFLEGVIENTKLKNFRGRVAPRNVARSRAYTRLDLHLEQEIPTFVGKSRISVFGDVENLPNLLNKDWGGFRQALFPYVEDVVRVQCLSAPVATGTAPTTAQINTAPTQTCAQYRYSSPIAPNDSSLETRRSLYLIRVGARFTF